MFGVQAKKIVFFTLIGIFLGVWFSFLGGESGKNGFQKVYEEILEKIQITDWNKKEYMFLCFFENIKKGVLIVIFSFSTISWMLNNMYFCYQGMAFGIFAGYVLQIFHEKGIGIIVAELFPQKLFYFFGAMGLMLVVNRQNRYRIREREIWKTVLKKVFWIAGILVLFFIGGYLESTVHMDLLQWLIKKLQLT